MSTDIQSQVWRGRLLDTTLTVTAAGNSHSLRQIPMDGSGLAVSAVLTSKPSAVQADSYLVVGLETMLPDGSWHLFARFSRHAATVTTERKRALEINVLKLASAEWEPSDGVATTDTATFVDDVLITGPVRARYAYTNGAATTIDWAIRVDLAIVGQPARAS